MIVQHYACNLRVRYYTNTMPKEFIVTPISDYTFVAVHYTYVRWIQPD